MREILFRGRDVDTGEWRYGDLVRNTDHDIAIYDCNIDTDYAGTPVLEETVGQYTGLKDKNGKRVFEGDCFDEYEDGEFSRFVVEYLSRAAVFSLATYGYKITYNESGGEVLGSKIEFIEHGTVENEWIPNMKITGTIHDTPADGEGD